jgi:predicted transcriptional regulator
LIEECNVAYALSVVEEIEGVEPSNYSGAIISADGNNWLAAMHDHYKKLFNP